MRIGYLIFILWLIAFPTKSRNVGKANADSITNTILPLSWNTLGEIVFINSGVWAFDRFVMNEKFARITPSTISRNLHHDMVWDNDRFSTNLLAHPYHGNLYFNAARNNGLNYWQALPYTLGGSLMWEYICETEPPAINDLIATTFGGMALGETAFRLSSRILDESSRGRERVIREVMATLISPVRGIKRLISGEMWAYRPHILYSKKDSVPLVWNVELGASYLHNSSYKNKHISPYLRLGFQYGNLFEESNIPFHHFLFDITLGMSDKQPLIQRISLTANLWSRNFGEQTKSNFLFGLFQYFSYYDSNQVGELEKNVPLRFSETASWGPGVRLHIPLFNRGEGKLEQHFYFGAVLLGGSYTDYYQAIDRDYNLGSGYTLKSHTRLQIGRWTEVRLGVEHYRLFTWKGYKSYELFERNLLYLNAQGDKGNVSFTVINPTLQIPFLWGSKLHLDTGFYFRKNYYHHREVQRTKAITLRLGVNWKF